LGVRFAGCCSGAVHKAAETNNVDMMRRLLNAGLDIEQTNKYGETPLVIAGS
jgi:ankyrin repeat protein